jgi:small subunit ribosomal protein S1
MMNDTEEHVEQPLAIVERAALAVEAPAPLATEHPPVAAAEPPPPITAAPQVDENAERRKRAQAAWERLVGARESGQTVEAQVRTLVKGGLLVDIDGYRGFLPASQTGLPKGSPLDTLVGTTIALKVIDVDEGRKRVVVSQRRAMQDERRAARTELLASLRVGQEREVRVVRLVDFGAFVDLGSGIDALIPVSELAFERVEKPGDVVKIGETLKVRVIRVENGGKKIAVSRKGALSDPWRDSSAILQRGKTVEGKVVRKDRGLEVEVAPGVVGLVSDRDANPDEYEIGETLEVTIRSVDVRTRRLRLNTPHAAAVSFSNQHGFAPLGAELKIPTASQTSES